MSDVTDYIKITYAELSNSDKLEIVRFINQYKDLSIDQRQLLKTGKEKTLLRSAGPRNTNVCPRCGK